MRPIDKDTKYICDYLRFTPNRSWSWHGSYRRDFMDALTFEPSGTKIGGMEKELAYCLKAGHIVPAKRFRAKVDSIADYEPTLADIDF